MKHLLIRLFNLPPEHAHKAVLMFGGLMCVAAAGLSARTVGDTLFLVRYGASWICYMYIGTALTVTGVALLLRRLSRATSLHRLITGFVLALGSAGLFLRMAVAYGPAWLSIPVYLWADVVATLVVVQFWTFTGSAFNPREAKPLFAFIGVGGSLAGAIFGLLIRSWVGWIGPENLLVVGSFLLAGFAVLLNAAVRAGVVVSSPPGAQARGARKGSRLSQAWTIGIMAAVATVSLTLVDYQFKAVARAHYPARADLASFFGVFYACNSVVSLGLQAFLVSRILKKGGVLVSLLILPASLLAGSAAILSTSAFEAVVATKFAHVLFLFTIDTTAFQILYLSISPQGRPQARTFVDGICRPVSLGLAGGLLILAIPHLSVSLVSALTLPLIVAWLVLVVANFRRYLVALMESLRKGRFEPSGETAMSDEASLEAMKRLLSTGTDDEVLYVSEIIRQMESVDCTREALAALARESTQVKVQALEYLRGRGRPVEVPDVEALLRHETPEVRACAAAVVCIPPGSKALAIVEPLLTDPDPRVRAEAAAGLIRCDSSGAVPPAWAVVERMVFSDDAEARSWGARALAHLGNGSSSPLAALKQEMLLRLLRDNSVPVRIAAVGAAERTSCPEATPLIAEMLAEDRIYEAAARALVAHGDESIPALRHAATPDASGRVGRAALRVPSVLARIGSRQALDTLQDLFRSSLDGLRHASVEATHRLLRARPDLRDHLDGLEELLLSEAGRTLVVRSLRNEFRSLPGTELLVATLEETYRDCFRCVFVWLGILFPSVEMEAIRRGVMEGTPEERASAVEVLDNTLTGDLHRRLMGPLLEPPTGPDTAIESAEERLRSLIEWPDDWLRACAVHAIGRGRIADLLPDVQRVVEGQDLLVKETAEWARDRLRGT